MASQSCISHADSSSPSRAVDPENKSFLHLLGGRKWGGEKHKKDAQDKSLKLSRRLCCKHGAFSVGSSSFFLDYLQQMGKVG